MRHHVISRQLGRTKEERRVLYKNLISSLLSFGAIETSQPKAKAVQGQVDKLLTKAKRGQLHDRRLIDQKLNSRRLTNHLVMGIAPAVGKRTSGFTRITKLSPRLGDNSLLVRLEFVDVVPPLNPVAVKSEKSKPAAKKSAKAVAKTKTSSVPVLDQAAPVTVPQAVIKPGTIRRKSGER